MPNISVLKSNKADSLIKKKHTLDKTVYVLSFCGHNISNTNDAIYIHLSCNDNPYIPARKHNDIRPLRNLECKGRRFYTDYSSMVTIFKRKINQVNSRVLQHHRYKLEMGVNQVMEHFET